MALNDAEGPDLYINRELSWIEFNRRVLEEAMDKSRNLLERVKFLSIFSTNLDEFFMIRVSGLHRQIEEEVTEPPPDMMSPVEQLSTIRKALLPLLKEQISCWREDVEPLLRERGVAILRRQELDEYQMESLRIYFEHAILPVLTPLAFDPGHPFPHISNLSMNLAIVLKERSGVERFARLKLPKLFPRLVSLPQNDEDEHDIKSSSSYFNFIFMEELIAANADLLFPGLEMVEAYPFRVTRDADIEIEEDEASDLLAAIKQNVALRRFGHVVRLEVEETTPERIKNILIKNLGINAGQVYSLPAPLGMSNLMELHSINRPDLKDKPFAPGAPSRILEAANIFDIIRERDMILYHPYDSFQPVVDFINSASSDPDVYAIKQTLYRVGVNSPVVDALLRAQENGKQVAVLVELKARFDEENNIVWAKALEDAGVHVIYGLVGLKTHAKMCLVVRKEGNGFKQYVHMSTGNYNTMTGKIYTDISCFTIDPDIASDISDLFNALTGYSRKTDYRKLLVAPGNLRDRILLMIENEIKSHERYGNGYIAMKMNALVDKPIIKALYRASNVGVKIEIQARSICCLRPGIPGISENINVTSVVGRFLEHSRIYHFHSNGENDLYLGSADLMPRNLDRRVEILFPVLDEGHKRILIDKVLKTHLRDNVNSRKLLPDGSYLRLRPGDGEEPLDSQMWMLEWRRSEDIDASGN